MDYERNIIISSEDLIIKANRTNESVEDALTMFNIDLDEIFFNRMSKAFKDLSKNSVVGSFSMKLIINRTKDLKDIIISSEISSVERHLGRDNPAEDNEMGNFW